LVNAGHAVAPNIRSIDTQSLDPGAAGLLPPFPAAATGVVLKPAKGVSHDWNPTEAPGSGIAYREDSRCRTPELCRGMSLTVFEDGAAVAASMKGLCIAARFGVLPKVECSSDDVGPCCCCSPASAAGTAGRLKPNVKLLLIFAPAKPCAKAPMSKLCRVL
jgi:hypothetical protein